MFKALVKNAKTAKARKVRLSGRRFEYAARDWFLNKCGLVLKSVRRVPVSGSGSDKGDLVLTTRTGEEFRVECKYRSEGFAFLYSTLAPEHIDFLFLSAERKPRLLVFDEFSFIEFMQEVYNVGYQDGKENRSR